MTSSNAIPVVVTTSVPGKQAPSYVNGQWIDIGDSVQVNVTVFETGQTGAKGKDGVTHGFTTINTDSSRPIAYWGYRLANDNTEHIAKLDYTSGQQPTVTRAAVTSVTSQWANRATLAYT
jgi:hypothetical protein